jgi:phosphonate transport system ATP-binding protein
MDYLLETKGLHKHYEGGTHALKGIDLQVKPGEFLVLLGLSGSGKSTFLRCVNRLIEPTAGEILFNGEEICSLRGEKLRHARREIGMIFQQFNLVKNLSVLTNVIAGRLGYLSSIKSIFPKFDHKLVAEAKSDIKRVGLAGFENQTVRNLSGGQQQRVAIARALMQHPKLILADEPVASLDPATADSVMKYLGILNKKDKITVICSLHFLSLARKYGSRVVALKDGELVFDGSPAEIDNERFKQIYGEDAEEVEIR